MATTEMHAIYFFEGDMAMGWGKPAIKEARGALLGLDMGGDLGISWGESRRLGSLRGSLYSLTLLRSDSAAEFPSAS